MKTKIFKVLIVFTLIFSTLLSACTPADNSKYNTLYDNRAEKFQGVHVFDAPEVNSEDYIVKDGIFQYTLVFPAKMNSLLSTAREEFLVLLKRATGCSAVDIISDDMISGFNADSDKYISFGDTTLANFAGVEYDKAQLKHSGVRIITKGKCIFLFGGDVAGIINAVYDFMKICFNYEFFWRNCLEIDTGIKNLKLKNFNVTDIPDIDSQNPLSGSYGSGYDIATEIDKMALGADVLSNDDIAIDIKNRTYRMHMQQSINQAYLPIYGKDHLSKTVDHVHNTLNFFSPVDLAEGCEENWFAPSHTQICWTAHGDEQSLERMKIHALNKIIDTLKKNPPRTNPYANNIVLGNEDGGKYCDCVECAKQKEQDGGSMAGASIRFANDLVQMVYDWMDKPENAEYKRDNLKIVIFAYSSMKDPPVYFDKATNDYKCVDGCEVDDRVCIWLTGGPVPYLSVYDDFNKESTDRLYQWAKVAKHLWFWQYAQFYGKPIYALDFMNGGNAERMKMLSSVGMEYVLTEIDSSSQGPVCWADLMTYMNIQLGWDCNQDESVLIEKYFKAMYKNAADTMLKLYNDQKMYFQFIMNEHMLKTNDFINIGFTFWSEEHYPYPVLRRWIDMIDQAIIDIEIYKNSNPDLYNAVKDRIEIASSQFLGVIFDIYGESVDPPFDEQTRADYKNRLISILTRYKVAGLDLAKIQGL